MSFQTAESRTKSGGRLCNVRRLWQCLALPCRLGVSDHSSGHRCPGPVSAGETNSYPAPQLPLVSPHHYRQSCVADRTYGFNEGSGNTTADASGNANVGTLSGPSWTTAGRYGYALSFNGTNAYVEAAIPTP